MQTMPGQPRGPSRFARALGLDRNPLRRASDRAEAWIRIGLLAVFLIAGPMAALAAGGLAYHAGITATRGHAAPTQHVETAAPQPTVTPTHPAGLGPAWAGNRWVSTTSSARSGEVLAAVMTLALTALATLAVLRLTVAILRRRRLAAWETAWSRVGPQWSRGKP